MLIFFDLLPLSASSGLKASMEGHANVCSFRLDSLARVVGPGMAAGTPIRASFPVHIHPMNVRHMSVSVVDSLLVRLDPTWLGAPR